MRNCAHLVRFKKAVFDYICSMNLLREICSVLDAASVEYSTKEIGGMDVIFTDRPAGGRQDGKSSAAIIPVSITAADTESARHQAEALRTTVTSVVQLTGLYPQTVAEDRWRLQHEMMRARLLAHVQIFSQIYARNCEIKKIDKQTAARFLDENHSYGDAKCRYRYGLYLKRHTGHNAAKTDAKTGADITPEQHASRILPGTLVAVATFSNARKWIKGDKTIRSYEWTRYASLPGVRLSGGMGKLLKAFIEEVNPDDIMTYADLEWSEGKVYETLGFEHEGNKEPVDFQIDTSWSRIPVKPGTTEEVTSRKTGIETSLQEAREEGNLYFRNLGSNKYRRKLTNYQ